MLLCRHQMVQPQVLTRDNRLTSDVVRAPVNIRQHAEWHLFVSNESRLMNMFGRAQTAEGQGKERGKGADRSGKVHIVRKFAGASLSKKGTQRL